MRMLSHWALFVSTNQMTLSSELWSKLSETKCRKWICCTVYSASHLYLDNPCSFRQSSSTADRNSQQPDLRLYTPHNYHRSCQADITGFSQHLPPAIQSLYSHMWVPDRLNTLSSLYATTSSTRLVVRQERSGQRSVESLSTSHQFLHSLNSVP